MHHELITMGPDTMVGLRLTSPVPMRRRCTTSCLRIRLPCTDVVRTEKFYVVSPAVPNRLTGNGAGDHRAAAPLHVDERTPPWREGRFVMMVGVVVHSCCLALIPPEDGGLGRFVID